MKKTLLSIGLFCLSFISNAQCTAVTALNENFETFTNNGPLPQNCWTASVPSPKVTIATVQANKVVQLYTSSTPTVPFFVVSPELSTIDGNHKLSFQLSPIAGTMTVQVGTLSNATDFTTFQAVGNPIEVSSTTTSFSNIIIPASVTQKFIAFRAVSVGMHQAAALDNIVYEPTLSIGESQLNTFKIYPNPSVNKIVTILYNNTISDSDKNSVTIYNLSGVKVFETEIEISETLNLSDLASGVYILKSQSGNSVTTKKLVLK